MSKKRTITMSKKRTMVMWPDDYGVRRDILNGTIELRFDELENGQVKRQVRVILDAWNTESVIERIKDAARDHVKAWQDVVDR